MDRYAIRELTAVNLPAGPIRAWRVAIESKQRNHLRYKFPTLQNRPSRSLPQRNRARRQPNHAVAYRVERRYVGHGGCKDGGCDVGDGRQVSVGSVSLRIRVVMVPIRSSGFRSWWASKASVKYTAAGTCRPVRATDPSCRYPSPRRRWTRRDLHGSHLRPEYAGGLGGTAQCSSEEPHAV